MLSEGDAHRVWRWRVVLPTSTAFSTLNTSRLMRNDSCVCVAVQWTYIWSVNGCERVCTSVNAFLGQTNWKYVTRLQFIQIRCVRPKRVCENALSIPGTVDVCAHAGYGRGLGRPSGITETNTSSVVVWTLFSWLFTAQINGSVEHDMHADVNLNDNVSCVLTFYLKPFACDNTHLRSSWNFTKYHKIKIYTPIRQSA